MLYDWGQPLDLVVAQAELPQAVQAEEVLEEGKGEKRRGKKLVHKRNWVGRHNFRDEGGGGEVEFCREGTEEGEGGGGLQEGEKYVCTCDCH